MFPNPTKALCALWVSMLICFKGFCQTTGYSQTGSNIDVSYYRCNWRINPDSTIKAIGGSVTMYFVTKAASTDKIRLDLNSLFTVSARYHGSAIVVTKPATNIIELQLPVTLSNNTVDSVTIFYNGTPPVVNGMAEGLQKKSSSVSNTPSASGNYIYTLSESYEDRDWWPCKADMQDKPDSMDFIVSVPDGFRVAAPGKFIDSSLNGTSRIFHYKTKHPIATYLVAVGVAKYRVYNRPAVDIGGTSVPVWYFILPGKTTTKYTSIVNALDNSRTELAEFSKKFGDYAFRDEKHGYYEFGWSGGMEHQSFSAMGESALTSWGTIAHELMHQWFGDKVTFATWQHLWLAEGFARYGEVLAAELVPALGQNAVNVQNPIKASATGTRLNGYSVFIPAAYITNSNQLWNSRYGETVYERGAMVVSMLRALVGDDKFFLACRNYLNDAALAYRSATTEDLKAHFNAVAGKDLTPFFNSWVYGIGNARYSINWGYNTSSKNIVFNIAGQTKNLTGAGVPAYYYTPVVLKVSGNGKDTTLVIYDENGTYSKAGNGISGSYSNNSGGIPFRLSFVPATVSVDPAYRTMLTGTANFLAALPAEIISFSARPGKHGNEIRLELTGGEEAGEVILQRSSDGKIFSNAGMMKQVSSGDARFVYAINDSEPLAITWYRARVQRDGREIFSRIEQVAVKQATEFSVSPNPANRSIVVKWDGTMPGAVMQLSSSTGTVIRSQTVSANETVINTAAIPSGTYVMQLNVQGNIVAAQRIVIQH